MQCNCNLTESTIYGINHNIVRGCTGFSVRLFCFQFLVGGSQVKQVSHLSSINEKPIRLVFVAERIMYTCTCFLCYKKTFAIGCFH